MVHWPSMLAQIDYAARVKGLQNAIRHEGPDPVQIKAIMGVLATIAGLALAILIASCLQRRRSTSLLARGPSRLFAYVLRQFGVALPDRLLFAFAARRCGLGQPALMLFSPELLNTSLGRWANSVKFSPLRRYIRCRIDLLAARAFTSGNAQQQGMSVAPRR